MTDRRRAWDLVFRHYLDELGVPPLERDGPPWDAHRRIPTLLNKHERLVELAQGVDVSARRGTPGVLAATNQRLVFLPLYGGALERWTLRSLGTARLDTSLVNRERSLVVATRDGQRRFRELVPADRGPHLVAALNRDLAPTGRRRRDRWSRTPAIARLGELAVHLDQINLPDGPVEQIGPGVGAHVEASGRAIDGVTAGGAESIALHIEGDDWTWATELPPEWLDEARDLAEAVGAAVRLAGPSRRGARDGVLDRLERLARLHQRGILTNEEVVAQKARIVGDDDGSSGVASG